MARIKNYKALNSRSFGTSILTRAFDRAISDLEIEIHTNEDEKGLRLLMEIQDAAETISQNETGKDPADGGSLASKMYVHAMAALYDGQTDKARVFAEIASSLALPSDLTAEKLSKRFIYELGRRELEYTLNNFRSNGLHVEF